MSRPQVVTLNRYLLRQRRTEAHIPHVFVEGKSDAYMVDRLKFEIEKKHDHVIDMRITTPDEVQFPAPSGGNRTCVKRVASEIVTQNSANMHNFIAFYDREFVDFDWVSTTSIVDDANGAEVYDHTMRLLRSCGHSAENYLFQRDLFVDCLEAELQATSDVAMRIRNLWLSNFGEMMAIAAALCIAIKKQHRLLGNIGENFGFQSSYISIAGNNEIVFDHQSWCTALAKRTALQLTPTLCQQLLTDYETELERAQDNSQEVEVLCNFCHGHLCIQFLQQAYKALLNHCDVRQNHAVGGRVDNITAKLFNYWAKESISTQPNCKAPLLLFDALSIPR